MVLLALIGSGPLAAQSAPPEVPAVRAEALGMQARFEDDVRTLQSDPQFRHIPPQQLRGLHDFVVGNMVFALIHEMGHVHISEMQLPVLGREEDAADAFATVTLLRTGTDIAKRVLGHVVKAWFMSDRRDRARGEKLAFYDEHGLDKQRGYAIVCMMVGSNPDGFKDLADATELPESRQETCLGDYSNASWSWEKLLKPHHRAAGAPPAEIAVRYADAEGRLASYARSFRALRLLETVAALSAQRWAWPRAFALEMRSCGAPDARWSIPQRQLMLCYELAEELADLYRNHAPEWRRPIRLGAR
jgi:hypothetical protein